MVFNLITFKLNHVKPLDFCNLYILTFLQHY